MEKGSGVRGKRRRKANHEVKDEFTDEVVVRTYSADDLGYGFLNAAVRRCHAMMGSTMVSYGYGRGITPIVA